MNELLQHSAERYFSPYDVARAYASLKDAAQTLLLAGKGL